MGRAVIQKLAENFTLVGFDREMLPQPPAAAECVAVDLISDESVEAALERGRIGYGNRISSVIRIAGYIDLTGPTRYIMRSPSAAPSGERHNYERGAESSASANASSGGERSDLCVLAQLRLGVPANAVLPDRSGCSPLGRREALQSRLCR